MYLQVEKVEALLSEWKGRVAIVLNADWAPDNVSSEFRKFAASFESVFSFLPVAIKVRSRHCH